MTDFTQKDDEITLFSFKYKKGDLDKAPADERLFYLMAGSVANDISMLNKLLLGNNNSSDLDNAIVNQGLSTGTFFILRMLSGRLTEAHKLTSKFSKMIKSEYEEDLSESAKDGFRSILRYFSNKDCLLRNVRDRMAFHHLPEFATKAYENLDITIEIGEYLHESVGNTLYYTSEILHYVMLNDIAELGHEASIEKWIDDASKQSKSFGDLVHGFAHEFSNKYLRHLLEQFNLEPETIPVIDFRRSSIPFFTTLPNISKK